MLDILFLLHIGEDLFLESKLSVVVPQAIGISLRNRIGDSDGERETDGPGGLLTLINT